MSMIQQVAAQDFAVATTDPIIRIEGLDKWYGKLHVLKNNDNPRTDRSRQFLSQSLAH